jgi:hypothetical protein
MQYIHWSHWKTHHLDCRENSTITPCRWPMRNKLEDHMIACNTHNPISSIWNHGGYRISEAAKVPTQLAVLNGNKARLHLQQLCRKGYHIKEADIESATQPSWCENNPVAIQLEAKWSPTMFQQAFHYDAGSLLKIHLAYMTPQFMTYILCSVIAISHTNSLISAKGSNKL